MTNTKADNRYISGDPKIFIEDFGYDIRKDSQQPGLWLWTGPSDDCDISYQTAKEALDNAWIDASGQAMGINNLSSEQWDAMSFLEQKTSISQAFSEYGDDGQDVVDDVLQRGEEYGFQPDEDMVRGAVEGSALLLNINLSEDQIIQACERVMQAEEKEPNLQEIQ